MNKRPGGALRKFSDTASNSVIFPLWSKRKELTRKAYLVPAITTMAFIASLFSTVGNPSIFWLLIAGFIILANYFFIYSLCGKTKHWWVLLGIALFTVIAINTPLLYFFIKFFRETLPGQIADNGEQSFLVLFIHMFFGAGLMEELFKALPVLVLAWLTGRLRSSSPWRERVGVTEPLDGILFGAASGAGFTLYETLADYVPRIANAVAVENGDGMGQLIGLQLLIPRIAASLFGHMAYSGYFGYFIGLAMLKPSNRWLILGVGYLSAALTHALWNSVGVLALSFLFQVAAGVIAYALLAAAILKARQISPNRKDNFVSTVLAFYLDIGGIKIKLHPGTTIRQSDVVGLTRGTVHGMLAVVDHNPIDTTKLGLKNLSSTGWNVAMVDGNVITVAPGKSIRLADDSVIDFGGVKGRVRQLSV